MDLFPNRYALKKKRPTPTPNLHCSNYPAAWIGSPPDVSTAGLHPDHRRRRRPPGPPPPSARTISVAAVRPDHRRRRPSPGPSPSPSSAQTTAAAALRPDHLRRRRPPGRPPPSATATSASALRPGHLRPRLPHPPSPSLPSTLTTCHPRATFPLLRRDLLSPTARPALPLARPPPARLLSALCSGALFATALALASRCRAGQLERLGKSTRGSYSPVPPSTHPAWPSSVF